MMKKYPEDCITDIFNRVEYLRSNLKPPLLADAVEIENDMMLLVRWLREQDVDTEEYRVGEGPEDKEYAADQMYCQLKDDGE